jgi:hypothetical protein
MFSIARSDPTLLDQYRRLSQFPNIAAGPVYAFSFLASAKASSGAYVSLYQADGLDLQVSIALPSGTSTIVGQAGAANVVAQAQAIAGQASFITVFFSATVPPSNPDLGIMPIDATYGAAIDASDVELVDTADYCH